MNLAMDKEAILPAYGPYHCQKLYNSHLLRFKIITPTIQTDTGEGGSPKDQKTMKTSPIHEPTKKS